MQDTSDTAREIERKRLLDILYILRPESYIFTDRPNAPLDEIQRNIDLARADQRFATNFWC